ncbi:MAG: FadR family transcriptional regulator [Gammaproteobacteria bacterium]|nr:FadR family transcriptional regulator [Gammaproteobacteria bacterium]
MSTISTPLFNPVGSRRIFEEVSEQITRQIANGTIAVGDKLPAERQLSEQFGISRAALREALRTLEFAGLIGQEKGVNGGSFILESEMGLLQPFQNMWQMDQLSFTDLMDARIEIQDIIIRLAVRKATERDFAVLDKDIARIKQHLKQDTHIDHKSTQHFYTLLANIAGNRVFTMIVKALSEIVPKSPPLTPDIIRVREGFMTHFRARDLPQASGILRDHLVCLKEQALQ